MNAPEGDTHWKKRPRQNSHRYDMYTDIRPLRGRTQYMTAYRRFIGLCPLHLRLFKEAPFGDGSSAIYIEDLTAETPTPQEVPKGGCSQ